MATFYCFGCGVGGDVFNFVMKIENMNLACSKDAAERAGVALSQDESPEARAAREKRRRLYECMEATLSYYRLFLRKAGMLRTRDYVKRHGLSDETARCLD